MNAEEIQARVTRYEEQKVRNGRIDWYDRNVPVWWKALKDLFNDPIWAQEDLNEYCKRWFACPEDGMRVLLGLSLVREVQSKEKKVPLQAHEHLTERKVALSPAEKQRAYRERKKLEERG